MRKPLPPKGGTKDKKRSIAAKRTAANRLRIGGRFISKVSTEIIKEAAESSGIDVTDIGQLNKFLLQEESYFTDLLNDSLESAPLTASAIERAIINAPSVYMLIDGERKKVDKKKAIHDIVNLKNFMIGFSKSSMFEFQTAIKLGKNGSIEITDFKELKKDIEAQMKAGEYQQDFGNLQGLLDALDSPHIKFDFTVFGSPANNGKSKHTKKAA